MNITLRDMFAMAALIALAGTHHTTSAAQVAQRAYDLAEAMMKHAGK